MAGWRVLVRGRRLPGRAVPHSFQGRLTVSVAVLVAAVLVIVSAIVYNRMDAYLRDQDRQALTSRATEVAGLIQIFALSLGTEQPIVTGGNVLGPNFRAFLNDQRVVAFLTDYVAQADLGIKIGGASRTSDGRVVISPANGGTIAGRLQEPTSPRESREQLSVTVSTQPGQVNPLDELWSVQVTLSNPFTTRATTMNAIVGLLIATMAGALVLSLVIAAIVARRFTRPLRRLSDAARGLGAGDLSRRVPGGEPGHGYTEASELASQFNQMASQLEASVEIIRRDRDRSREFLADVSHELRTPIAALRTFVELLKTGAADDPAARDEFLDASQVQLTRLDWLAQNLLELSKLESGLLALDLRPEDLRATVESAVEQAEAGAKMRNVDLVLDLPRSGVRVRHDPPRIGQVVSNLVGNALKFTPPGGHVTVSLRRVGETAEIEVRDTGVGIGPDELPHIFERFFRGAQAHEARGSGSGLGLAIVKSIVDMHGGRISVRSAVGAGTTFVVSLPVDPREIAGPSLDPAPLRGKEAGPGRGLDEAALATAGLQPATRDRDEPAGGTPASPVARESLVATGTDGPAPAGSEQGPAPGAATGREVVNS